MIEDPIGSMACYGSPSTKLSSWGRSRATRSGSRLSKILETGQVAGRLGRSPGVKRQARSVRVLRCCSVTRAWGRGWGGCCGGVDHAEVLNVVGVDSTRRTDGCERNLGIRDRLPATRLSFTDPGTRPRRPARGPSDRVLAEGDSPRRPSPTCSGSGRRTSSPGLDDLPETRSHGERAEGGKRC